LEFLRASYSPLEPPDAELNAAEFSVEVAERGVELAQARLDQVNAGVSELQVTMAQASLEEAQANLDLVDRQLEKLRLTSPRTGRVSEVFVREGEVAPVGETLLEVLDVKALRLRVFVPEAQLSRINLGGQVRIMVDSYPDEVFQGSILHIADEAQFTPTTVQTQEERVKLVFAILIAVEDPGGRLKAGMPADAELEIDS
jgi:HlyD family secretion protein